MRAPKAQHHLTIGRTGERHELPSGVWADPTVPLPPVGFGAYDEEIGLLFAIYAYGLLKFEHFQKSQV